MNKLFRTVILASPIMLASQLLAFNSRAFAQETQISNSLKTSYILAQTTNNSEMIDRVSNYGREGRRKTKRNQVTSVFQLRDVSPRDWAYEALRSLVERYGCIEGYPNRTFRGNRALSRYEFAAGLNACLQQIERLLASTQSILQEDIATLQRLTREFEAELAALGARVDNLEGRVAFLEDNQFSVTTKLEGEVVFGVADAFEGIEDSDDETVLQNRVRFLFNTSFDGTDNLFIRFDSGDAAFFDETTDQGAFTYSFDNGNNVEIGWLAYYFNIGEDIRVYVPTVFPLWQDIIPTVSPVLEGFTNATGAVSSFAESSPIYKIGLAAGGGLALNIDLTDHFVLSGGYFGGDSFDPTAGNGLFNGEYSALGQITWRPNDNIELAFTYVNAFFNEFSEGNEIFDLFVGTENARAPFGDGADVTAITNTYGVQGAWRISPRFVVNAFGGFTDVQRTSGAVDDTDAEIWFYAVGLGIPDLGKEGSLGALLVGAEPYLGGVDDTAVHIEAFYKYALNDNIAITPTIIVITAPFGDSDNDAALIGNIRTVFTF